MTAKNILITGMTGLIGQVVRKRLERRYNLTALNRSRPEGVKCHQADIADLAAIGPAFEGQDVVVHLAARVATDATWKDLLPANVIGVRNVFEAARPRPCQTDRLRKQRRSHQRLREGRSLSLDRKGRL